MSPTREDILRAARNVGGPFADMQPVQTFGDVGADSLDIVELAMALEGAFGLSIDDDVVERWMTDTTLDQVIDHILSKGAA